MHGMHSNSEVLASSFSERDGIGCEGFSQRGIDLIVHCVANNGSALRRPVLVPRLSSEHWMLTNTTCNMCMCIYFYVYMNIITTNEGFELIYFMFVKLLEIIRLVVNKTTLIDLGIH